MVISVPECRQPRYNRSRMPDSLSPHPTLSRYYGEPGSREPFVRKIFDDTAYWYDDVDEMLSRHREWFRSLPRWQPTGMELS